MVQNAYLSAMGKLVAPLDRTLMSLILAVLALSLTIQYSANDMSLQATQQHAVRIGIGLLALLAMAHITPRRLRRWAPPLFLLNLLLLVVVLFYGSGGHRPSAGWRSAPLPCNRPNCSNSRFP